MNKLRSQTVMVLVAGLLNITLAVFFVWLTLNPPAFYGKAPDRDLTYLIFATYSLINFVSLLFLIGSKGIHNQFRQLVYGFNVLLVLGAIVFGIASALESIYSGPEIFVTLCLLIPPLMTVAGFYSQQKDERIYAIQCAQNGQR